MAADWMNPAWMSPPCGQRGQCSTAPGSPHRIGTSSWGLCRTSASPRSPARTPGRRPRCPSPGPPARRRAHNQPVIDGTVWSEKASWMIDPVKSPVSQCHGDLTAGSDAPECQTPRCLTGYWSPAVPCSRCIANTTNPRMHCDSNRLQATFPQMSFILSKIWDSMVSH